MMGNYIDIIVLKKPMLKSRLTVAKQKTKTLVQIQRIVCGTCNYIAKGQH